VVQHPFKDYATQRNAALATLPIASEWTEMAETYR